MESTVDFDFYSSSLLQTCFIVFGTFSSKTPKQVFFNPINIFDSFSFTLVNHNKIILKDLHRLRIVDIQERITEKVQVQLQNQKTTMLLLCMVQIKWLVKATEIKVPNKLGDIEVDIFVKVISVVHT